MATSKQKGKKNCSQLPIQDARNFQYKILNNTLYLNNRLALFGFANTTNCSFCGTSEENFNHLFVECSFTTALWQELISYFPPLVFPALTPQGAYLGFLDDKIENLFLINHILLIFKIYVYNSRDVKRLSFVALLARIEKIFNLEIKSQLIRNDNVYTDKWRCITHILSPVQ